MGVSASISAADEFSDPLAVKPGHRADVSISGTFTADVVVQRRLSGETEWRTLGTYSEPTELTTEEVDKDWLFRAGVEDGGYTSGTVEIRID